MVTEIDFNSLILDSIFASVPTVIKATWPLLIATFVIGAVKLSFALYRRHKILKAGMTEIDKMDGRTFENFLAGLFTKMGYSVKQVGSFAGDYGADLIITKDNKVTAVQAKRYKSAVGVDAIREVLGSIKMYKCSNGLVVTNSFFTMQAKRLAQANDIELWDKYILANRILNTKNKN